MKNDDDEVMDDENDDNDDEVIENWWWEWKWWWQSDRKFMMMKWWMKCDEWNRKKGVKEWKVSKKQVRNTKKNKIKLALSSCWNKN
jgi:hypothetical protein